MNINARTLAITPFSRQIKTDLSVLVIAGIAAFSAATVSAQSSMSPAERPSMQPRTTEQAPSAPGGMAPNRQPSEEQVTKQFQAADANGDGKLSKEEAKTAMPGVYRNFERIDTKAQGFITKDDLMMAMAR